MNSEKREKRLVLIFDKICRCLEVLLHHLLHEVIERHDTLPAELGLCFRRVTQQQAAKNRVRLGPSESRKKRKKYALDLGRTEVSLVDFDDDLA